MSMTSLLSTSPDNTHLSAAALLPSPPACLAKASADRFLREHAPKLAGSKRHVKEAGDDTVDNKKIKTDADALAVTQGIPAAAPHVDVKSIGTKAELTVCEKIHHEGGARSSSSGGGIRSSGGGSEAVASELPAKKASSSAVVQQPPEEVAGFVRTLFTLLRVCDSSVVSWSEDGNAMLIHDPMRFAGEICPKFFRHRNFNSFTRLLNMYQFHKVPGNGRDKTVTFVHPSFRRGRDDLLSKIQRKGSSSADKNSSAKDDETAARRRKEAAERKDKRDAERERQRADKRPKASATDDGSKQTANGSSKSRRAPSIFPSAAHYRAAAGTPEALIGRDVWERTNAEITELEKRSGYLSQSTVGGSSAVSTWMRRVVELEREARALKAENERLRGVEVEIEQLRGQVQAQNELIAQIQLIEAAFSAGAGQLAQPTALRTTANNTAAHDATDDDPNLWRQLLAGQPQPQQPPQNETTAESDPLAALPRDAQFLLRNALQQTGQAQDDPSGAALVQLLSKLCQQQSDGNGLPPEDGAASPPAEGDATAAAAASLAADLSSSASPEDMSNATAVHYALLQQQQQQSGAQSPKLDLSTLMNEPFTAQCMAQCFAMTGALPST